MRPSTGLTIVRSGTRGYDLDPRVAEKDMKSAIKFNTIERRTYINIIPVTQYPIPAITVPGRMRYSRHKRSGISYGCHNESPGLLLTAISDLASL